MHSGNSGDKLRRGDNHGRASEYIVDEVEEDEDDVSDVAISNADEFQRRVSIRNS